MKRERLFILSGRQRCASLWNRRLVGRSMDSRMTQTLVMAALTTAYWKKKPKPGSLHHSGCGGHYCSAAYRALQASDDMQTSISRKGNGWEFAVRRHLHALQSSHNAPMESFFGALITECLPHYGFDTKKQSSTCNTRLPLAAAIKKYCHVSVLY